MVGHHLIGALFGWQFIWLTHPYAVECEDEGKGDGTEEDAGNAVKFCSDIDGSKGEDRQDIDVSCQQLCLQKLA